MPDTPLPKVLVLACGALAREISDIVRSNGWDHITLQSLPATLHNRPERIPAAVARRLEASRGLFDSVLVGYADCGTGGRLDAIVEQHGAVRLPGAHCYEFFSTAPVFAEIAGDEVGTFFLTDYLARHFDRIVWAGLGLDQHPELLDVYFGNYTRIVYLSQRPTEEMMARGRAVADRLGLRYEHRHVGYGDLDPALRNVALSGPSTVPMPVLAAP
jgi:hypothetical protein